MPRLGAHISILGGLHLALERGQSIGCETIQVFTRNSNRWQSKQRTPEELELFRKTQGETGIHPVVAHAIYLINLASPDPTVRTRSNDAFREELARCQEADIPYLVLHPGSHRGSGLDRGIARIAQGINAAYAEHPQYTVLTLLENTAGQGDTIGRTFEELAQIAGRIQEPSRIGYCLDTAHALASGYELRTAEGYGETMQALENCFGAEMVKFFHLNDSKKELGSRIDRHEHIGKGAIGVEGFRNLLSDERFKGLPMTLETPKSDSLVEDIENLQTLRALLE